MKRYFTNPVFMESLGRNLEWKRENIEKIKKAGQAADFYARRKNCPICGGDELSPYISIYDYDYYLCNNCNHLFYVQMIDEKRLKEIYNEDTPYLTQYTDGRYYQQRLSNIAVPRVNFVTNHIFKSQGKEPKGSAWLDIGCGGGHVLVAAKNAGYKARGIEAGASGSYVTEKYGIPVQQAYITPETFNKKILDARIISLFDVLEHLKEPGEILSAISDNMPPDAYVVASVPRHPSYSLLSILSNPEHVSRYLIVPDHIHIFSDESIEVLFNSCKLTIECNWYFGQDFFEMLNTLLYPSGIDLSQLDPVYTKALNSIQHAIDKNLLSDSMLVIAKKENRNF